MEESSTEDKCLSSDSDGSSDPIPQLPHDMILELAKYLNVETMKSARLISTAWHEGIQDEFRRNAILKPEFKIEMSIREFVKIFSPDTDQANSKLITSSMWIKKPNHLNHQLMSNWLETYGVQLTTLKLGSSVAHWKVEKLFLPESIKSILTRYCPNLKVLKVLTPFVSSSLDIKYINPDPKDVKGTLDYLEIGYENKDMLEFYNTSEFLLNILKCIKAVKSIKIAGICDFNLEKSRHWAPTKRPGDDYAKEVFENIQEFSLSCTDFDNPCALLEGPEMRFPCLQKLQIGSFCVDTDTIMNYLPALLTLVKDHLKELIFCQCPVKDHDDFVFVCPTIDKCILQPMPTLEIFQIVDIMKWKEPSLDFLEKLPALKQLKITLDHKYFQDKPRSLKKIVKIFVDNKSTKGIVHQNLEQLTFRCSKKLSKNLMNIWFCCPNLKKLEMDFCRTPIFSGFEVFEKLKDLTIHLFEPFESLGAHDLEGLSTSGIEKLCLERDHYQSKLPISLCSIVAGCLASDSLKKLELKGMKIRKEDYQSAMEKLQTGKLQLWLNNCEIEDD